MEFQQDDITRILASILCGSLMGLEREYRNKTAGFRTIILICLGSTVFTMVSQRMGYGSDDRIAANIITGIGFIGAGVIFKDNYSVTGITTAAVIWIAASIGMVVGISEFLMAFLLTIMVIVILSVFHYMEGFLDRIHHNEFFNITFADDRLQSLELIEKLISENGLRSKRKHLAKSGGHLTAVLKVSGNKDHIRKVNELLVARSEIVKL